MNIPQVPLHLFNSTRDIRKGRPTDALSKPMIAFLLSSCVNGDPNGGMTFARLRVVFLAWFQEYMKHAYQVRFLPEMNLYQMNLIRIFEFAISDPKYILALHGEAPNPYTYKNTAVVDPTSFPKIIRVTTSQIPCVFGLTTREKGIELPEEERISFEENSPPTFDTAIGTFTNTKEYHTKFNKEQWTSAVMVRPTYEKEHLLTLNEKTKRARQNRVRLNLQCSTI
ncbi:MAG: hypothetical protein WC477_07325 [Patescibacteria group bacterium]